MDRPTGQLPEVIPAQLEYLSIYNPTIGSGEDAIKEQILFYTSRKLRAKYRGRGQSGAVLYDEHEEENEKLRQVGLAQGMIEFAR